MRQFLLGKSVAYPTAATDYTKLAEGQFGVFVNVNGLPTLDTTGAKVKDVANLVLGRSIANGGPIVIPISKEGFSFVKGNYSAATTFKGTVEIPEITNVGTYSIMLVKKGKPFNDRHKFTADIYVRDISTTPDEVASKLATAINNNTISNGVTATVEGAIITIIANEKGVDYNIVCCDELMSVSPTIVTSGIPAYGDAKYVSDLACKAASDAGFEYTFEEDIKLYPAYPLDPLEQTKAADTGFTIFTLNFFESRKVKAINDDVVKQIVQIALPTGSAQIATLETIFTAIAG